MTVRDFIEPIVYYQDIAICNSDYDVECACKATEVPNKFLIHTVTSVVTEKDVIFIRCSDL